MAAETFHCCSATTSNSMSSPLEEVISGIRLGAKRLKASNMNSQSPQTDGMEPDSDAIKMFVGQVPRSMDENDLRKMFEEFGPIYQLNVLRDKVTGQSKGCCFITFFTRKAALDAQNQLHNIKTMAGMQHPIQMKPADSEKLEERKLFIGMLAKKSSENDVRMMFAPFGQIEECTVLREQNGSSKGCAFVTYASKQCATNCIKAMHHSQTMEGCRYPLVVKCADTQKEKEMKKIQQMNTSLLQNISTIGGGGGGGGGIGGMNPQYLALFQQLMASGAGGNQQQQQTPNMGGNLGNLGLGLGALQMPQILAAAASAAAALQNNPALAATLATLTSAMNNTNLAPIGGGNLPQTNGQSTHNGSSTSSTPNSAGDMSSMQNMQQIQGLAALAAMANNPGLSGSVQPQNLAMLQQLLSSAAAQGQQMPNLGNAGSNSPNSSAGGSMSTSTSSMSNPSAAPGMLGNYSHNMATGGATGSNGASGLSLGGSMNGMNNSGSVGSGTSGQQPGNQGNTGPPSAMDTINQAYTGIQQYAGLSGLLNQASFPNAFSPPSATPLQQNNSSAASPAGKQTEGPEGANLFIYHLPQEFSDHDLLQMFLPFGAVVSSKVFIDKQTNLSKCFGFVSYDNAVSAQAAIQAMNGFQIGMKRLKVQLKRPKNDSKPY